jgi:hypothetical protein
VFGLPRAVFPALALTVFGGGARTPGLLYAAPGAGTLLGALTTGWIPRIRGLACMAGALILACLLPAFRRQTTPAPDPDPAPAAESACPR